MSTPLRWALGLIVVAALGAAWWFVPRRRGASERGEEVVVVTDYRRPEPKPDDLLVDDRIEDKATSYDPDLVDPRPLGGWRVNLSDAVVALDTPPLRPDLDADLLELRPSFKAAAEAARSSARRDVALLPSVSLIDGKAKQVDDGLVAALDLATTRGIAGAMAGNVDLVRRLLAKVGPSSPAAPYLAGALALVGVEAKVEDETAKAAWLARFEANAARSRPTGFYTWSKPLSDCFRFLRYCQRPLPRGEEPVAQAVVAAMKADPALLADSKRSIAFFSGLTAPPARATFVDVAEGRATLGPDLRPSLFPDATNREAELFEHLFPTGLTPGADLMRAMVARVRSGEVSLEPGPDGGWYDQQVYALETLLLPDLAEEKDKLLLSRAYKNRMIDAFKAMMTKRRETHVRGLATATAKSEETPPSREIVRPRLRLEPSPTYYLRTARAYGFLLSFLESTIGAPALERLHGLRDGGERPLHLRDELQAARDLFYGFYLLSAEDIGLRPHFLDGESVDVGPCTKRAADWLARPFDDPDLAVDARVSAPVYLDHTRGATRIWATLGVRLARLDARYARAPRISPAGRPAEWKSVEPGDLADSNYLIPIDEFAEVELNGIRTLTRDELRAACAAGKTKEGIVAALGSPPR